ncbi:MAG: TonB-dependent receptor [Pseudomonadota bacterium]|nr:TonB-dependent receptor [Pseudomonadota bacterium]
MRKSVWLLSAGLIALAAPVQAQQTDTDGAAAQPTEGATAEAGAVDDVETQPDTAIDNSEIVVTATRRNEALSDVPLAVSAVTAQTLENSGATDIRGLTQVSPSLLVSSTSSEAGAGGARIRGVGTVGDNPGLESSVAVFIDGVYRSRVGLGLTELGQVDRIEVLRGPQGTLFGRNASAGLISIITAKPRFETQFNGQVDIGNYNLRRLELGATGPITDSLAARIDGVFMKREGFLEDVISGRDVNDRDRWLLRGQLLYQPSDDLSVRFIGDYSRRDEECCAATFLPARDNTTAGEQPSSVAALERALGAFIGDDTFERDISITPGRSYRSDVKDGGVSAELVYDFGGAELTSISAYRFNKYIRGQDADFNNLDILFRDDDGGAFNRFRTFTQEVRLQGETFGGRLDWLVGGYYANEKLRLKDNLAFGNDFLKFANCLLASSALPAVLDPTNPSCINPTVLAGAQAQVNAGIAALTAGINALSAIPPALRTPAQQAQLNALIAQRAGLLPTQGLLGALNANPANPGFGSVANALGIPGNNPFLGVGADDLFDQRSNNFALFTHNIFEIAEGLNLTVGARYTRERKKLDATLNDNNVFCRTIAASPLAALQQLACVVPSTPGGSFSGSSTKTEGKLSGTVVLSFKPFDELLTYASYSRGYKGGGFNLDRAALPRSGATQNGAILPGASLDSLQFNPEINDAVELGAKYNGRGFDVNVAVFQQLFDDFQLNLFNGIAFEVDTVNSCNDDLDGADTDNSGVTGACDGKIGSGVRSRGVEVELFTRPMPDLTLNLGGIYANTRYRDNLVGADGDATSAQLFQLPGRRLSNSAAFVATGSIGWTPPIGGSGLRGLVYFDARHSSEFNTGSDLDREKIQDSYTVVNGRIGIRGPDQRWAVELWAQNLLDKDYKQVAFDAPLQGSGTVRGVERGFYPRSTQLFGAFLAEPRTYGMTVRAKFAPPRAAPPVFVPPPAPPPMQTCPDGSVIDAAAACPLPPAPPVYVPPPPPEPMPERG